MPYEFYKILHFASLLLTFTSLAGYIFYRMQNPSDEKRKLFAILHGIGLLILLVSGFGLAARLGFMSQLPLWVYIKLFAWLLAGAAFALIKRQVLKPMGLYTFVIAIGIFAAVTAVMKFN
ncbi:MAG: SirB2 family protein [Bdellovibrionaceae bacterium]|nr:SirB2 family protein [Pseudobdellovibrionaceae bacterium]